MTDNPSRKKVVWVRSSPLVSLEEQDDSGRWRNSGVGRRATRGRAANIGRAVPGSVNVPTEEGGGRSKPAEEAEPVVPPLAKCTRANTLRKSSETLQPQQKRSESEAETLEPPAGGVVERRQRRVTRSSQEFSNAAG